MTGTYLCVFGIVAWTGLFFRVGANDCTRCVKGTFKHLLGCGGGASCHTDSDCGGSCMTGQCLGTQSHAPETCAIDNQCCCQKCVSHGTSGDCQGIYFLGDEHDCSVYTGSGDFIPGTGTVCPPLAVLTSNHFGNHSLSESDQFTYMHDSFVPVLTSDGKLEQGKHTSLDLGRPGLCAADVGVSVEGHAFAFTMNLTSLGDCCDYCSTFSSCTAWNFYGGNCTLHDTEPAHITWHEGANAFSGLRIRTLLEAAILT